MPESEPNIELVYRLLGFAHEIDHVMQAIKYNTMNTDGMNIDGLRDCIKNVRKSAIRAEVFIKVFQKEVEQYCRID